ncbi:hypothetical protein LSUB1_G002363 [Lachnellula subtilissima]|uniref:Transmembrane protein n=1 Tax=Lachnellula subtilissima TaxID=602034 RepID=A0A8H8RXN0_9HELO|nr:hypothetical protein LSUB1_G002363 [Lachnellula subtilissima]
METRRPTRSKRACQCTKSPLPSTSTLLFLSLILPSSSFAQLPIHISNRQDNNNPSLPPPTTLLISPTSLPPTPTPTPTSTTPPPATSSPAITTRNTHAFSYYFLIIAAVAVLACLGILYVGRLRRRKAALARETSQQALARDVAGYRSRFGRGPYRGEGTGRLGMGLGLGWNAAPSPGYNAGRGNARRLGEEGLDERGEAPPPYGAEGKPPSLRSVEHGHIVATTTNENAGGRRSAGRGAESDGEAVELRRMSGDTQREVDGHEPPGYHAAVASGDAGIWDITRPTPAIIASTRFESTTNEQH